MDRKLTRKEQEARRKEFEQRQEAVRLRAVENFRSRIGNLCAVGLFSEREAERLVRRKDEAMQFHDRVLLRPQSSQLSPRTILNNPTRPI